MPPKAKFTRQEIIDAAFLIGKTQGFSAITARRLGAQLGSSTRPIFSVFESMEEVIEGAHQKAVLLFNSYIQKGLKSEGFKGTGRDYIQFAIDEPILFREMFMSDGAVDMDLMAVMEHDDNYESIIEIVMKLHKCSRDVAVRLYEYMFIISHGIATLCANHMCVFTPEQIDELLTLGFAGISGQINKKDN